MIFQTLDGGFNNWNPNLTNNNVLFAVITCSLCDMVHNNLFLVGFKQIKTSKPEHHQNQRTAIVVVVIYPMIILNFYFKQLLS